MQVEERLQDVEHLGHLREDERLVAARLEPGQQPRQLLWNLGKMYVMLCLLCYAMSHLMKMLQI